MANPQFPPVSRHELGVLERQIGKLLCQIGSIREQGQRRSLLLQGAS